MAKELIRAACEAANCKYPDMEAIANFKREVTPSAVIGLLDGLRHAKGIAAINDARASGAAETIQHLRAENAALRAQLPSQVGEAVEATCWQYKVYEERRFYPTDPRKQDFWAALDGIAHSAEPLYTHPADQVADDLTMVKVSRELLEQIAVELEHDNDRYFLGRELRALLNGGR